MAVASMHLGVWSWSRKSPELQTVARGERRMGRQIQADRRAMQYAVKHL